jgi:hypothetical protein
MGSGHITEQSISGRGPTPFIAPSPLHLFYAIDFRSTIKYPGIMNERKELSKVYG